MWAKQKKLRKKNNHSKFIFTNVAMENKTKRDQDEPLVFYGTDEKTCSRALEIAKTRLKQEKRKRDCSEDDISIEIKIRLSKKRRNIHGENIQEDTCPICIFTPTNPVRFDCGCKAMFCTGCAVQLFIRETKTCPCCRGDIHAYIPKNEKELWDLNFIKELKENEKTDEEDELLDFSQLFSVLPLRQPVMRSRVIIVRI